MGINSVNDYAGLLQNYRVPTIPSVSLDEVRRQDEASKQSVTPIETHESPAVSTAERKDAPLEDISIVFNKSDDFGYIGKDSNIRSLDVQKALDDMKRDQVLQQYQYFVGSSRNIISDNADGMVIQKM